MPDYPFGLVWMPETTDDPRLMDPAYAHFSCTECDEPIADGDPITPTPGGWMHNPCRTGPTGRIETTETCDRCWMRLALDGSCGCDEVA